MGCWGSIASVSQLQYLENNCNSSALAVLLGKPTLPASAIRKYMAEFVRSCSLIFNLINHMVGFTCCSCIISQKVLETAIQLGAKLNACTSSSAETRPLLVFFSKKGSTHCLHWCAANHYGYSVSHHIAGNGDISLVRAFDKVSSD
jgi:hypothetical protein